MEHELEYASVHEYARTKALGEAAVLKVCGGEFPDYCEFHSGEG